MASHETSSLTDSQSSSYETTSISEPHSHEDQVEGIEKVIISLVETTTPGHLVGSASEETQTTLIITSDVIPEEAKVVDSELQQVQLPEPLPEFEAIPVVA